MRLAFIFLLFASPAAAQLGSKYEWPTELAGGALADLVARGPWMTKKVRHSPLARVTFATALSLTYEYVIEPWNDQTNAGRWQDVAMRFVGTLACEGLLGMFTKDRSR